MTLYGSLNVANGIVLIITAFFILFTVRKSADNVEAKYSTIVTFLLTTSLGIYVTGCGVFVLIFGPASVALNFRVNPYPNPLSGVVIFMYALIFLFIAIYALVERFIKKQYATEEAQNEVIKRQSFKNSPLDLELSRKLFHTLVNGFIVCYLIIGVLAFEAVYDFVIFIDPQMSTFFGGDVNIIATPELIPLAGRTISIFILTLVFYIVVLTDLVRIYQFRYYPIKQIHSMIRPKERNVFGPHVYLVTGMLVAVVLFPPIIAMVAISVAALGDAMATIAGVTLGRHKVHPSHPETRKTWEGCIGGIMGSFVFGFGSYLIMTNYYFGITNLTTILSGVLISLAGAGVFFLIDYFSPPLKISDNVLNPVLASMVGLLIFSLFFPEYVFAYYFI